MTQPAASPGRALRRGPLIVFVLTVLVSCASPPNNTPAVYQQGEDYLRRGVAAYRDGNYATAVSMFDRALAHYQSIDDTSGALRSRINLAQSALVLGNVDAAREHLAHALILAGRQDHQRYADRIALLQSSLALRQRNYAHAQALLAPLVSRPISHPSHVTLGALANRTRLAIALNADDARSWFERLEAALQATNDAPPLMMARAQRFRAELARQDGDLDAAEEHLQQAYVIYQSAAYRPGIAASLEEWGAVAMSRDQWARAADLLHRALLIRVHLLDRDRSLATLEALQLAYRNSGDAELAQRAGEWLRVLRAEGFGAWPQDADGSSAAPEATKPLPSPSPDITPPFTP